MFFSANSSGRSASIQVNSAGRSSRYGRVSRPAAKFKTRSQPLAIARAMASSMIFVRATSHQPLRVVRGTVATIARPCSPASRLARGSLNNASGRADSVARYRAVHRAVSETWVITCPSPESKPAMYAL